MKRRVQMICGQFLRFGTVGVLNVFVNLMIYYLLLYLGICYIVANTVGYAAGIVNSYYWNNRFVFRAEQKGSFWKKFGKVCATYIVTYLLTTILLYCFVELWGISEKISPILILLITTTINFILNKYWAFGGIEDEDCNSSDSNI